MHKQDQYIYKYILSKRCNQKCKPTYTDPLGLALRPLIYQWVDDLVTKS